MTATVRAITNENRERASDLLTVALPVFFAPSGAVPPSVPAAQLVFSGQPASDLNNCRSVLPPFSGPAACSWRRGFVIPPPTEPALATAFSRLKVHPARWRSIAARRAEKAAYQKAYRLAHRAEKAARQKAFRAAHRAKIAARNKAYQDAHRVVIAAAKKAYYAAHRAERAAHSKAYRQTHQAEEAARKKAYHESHRGEIAARGKAHRLANPAKCAARCKAYTKANPDKIADLNAKRRALKRGATIEQVSRAVVYERGRGICYLCGKRVPETDWHLEHIKPLALGGEHSYRNVAVSCPACNLAKGVKLGGGLDMPDGQPFQCPFCGASRWRTNLKTMWLCLTSVDLDGRLVQSLACREAWRLGRWRLK